MPDKIIGQQQPVVNINADDCDSLYCLNCKKLGKDYLQFRPVVEFKIVPMTMSPDGRQHVMGMTCYVCTKCGGKLVDPDSKRVIMKIEQVA